MTLAQLIAHYGLPALFVGAAVEGETVVVAGGIAAHQGLLPLVGAMIATATGSFAADQAWFALGRRFRNHRLVRRAREKPAFAKATDWLERWPIGFIFAFRFIYGFRTISPIAIGTTKVPAKTFVLVNAASAIVWGITFTTIGYLFGKAFERLIGKVTGHLPWLLGGLALIAIAVAAVHWWRSREQAA
ncbi:MULTISPECIES: DedA family protein [unclassified Sphingomonas]|jgi:membrane protein DedA with SNARE-associated domain|uniref:DedA family protein n=1 Tax=unclassified Sphingomonas TaxID=196159 RepID=UPI000E10394B|nr:MULTISPECIES: DedA family protein [unclassified Sphingomonas]AXJ95116.1 DedA family protein [Sphingomonas sp. FARSPH]